MYNYIYWKPHGSYGSLLEKTSMVLNRSKFENQPSDHWEVAVLLPGLSIFFFLLGKVPQLYCELLRRGERAR